MLGSLAVDYDATNLAEGYDRARSHGPEVLALWLQTVASYAEGRPVARIVDVGCGTGRHAAALAEHFGAEVIGVDPSRKMLEVARAKAASRRVRYELGRGEALPVEDGWADLVFASMVFHHLEDPLQMARECRRVLRAGGFVFLRNGVRERAREYPYVPFFPASVPLLLERLPARASVVEAFARAGLGGAEVGVVVQQVSPTLAEYGAKLRAGGDSVLSSLEREAFAAGLAALDAHAARVDPEPVCETIDVFVFR